MDIRLVKAVKYGQGFPYLKKSYFLFYYYSTSWIVFFLSIPQQFTESNALIQDIYSPFFLKTFTLITLSHCREIRTHCYNCCSFYFFYKTYHRRSSVWYPCIIDELTNSAQVKQIRTLRTKHPPPPVSLLAASHRIINHPQTHPVSPEEPFKNCVIIMRVMPAARWSWQGSFDLHMARGPCSAAWKPRRRTILGQEWPPLQNHSCNMDL